MMTASATVHLCKESVYSLNDIVHDDKNTANA